VHIISAVPRKGKYTIELSAFCKMFSIYLYMKVHLIIQMVDKWINLQEDDVLEHDHSQYLAIETVHCIYSIYPS